MKLLDYIEKLPIGGVVTNKRLLAVLKRKGLIFDYSFFGDIEPCYIYCNGKRGLATDNCDRTLYLFPNGNAPRNYIQFQNGNIGLDVFVSLNCNRDELNKIYGYDGGVIEYKGNYFTMQYLIGCFSPYLVKCDKEGHYSRKHSISFRGSIV